MRIGTLEKSHPRKYTENWLEGSTVTSLTRDFLMSSTESSQERATGPPVLTAEERQQGGSYRRCSEDRRLPGVVENVLCSLICVVLNLLKKRYHHLSIDEEMEAQRGKVPHTAAPEAQIRGLPCMRGCVLSLCEKRVVA